MNWQIGKIGCLLIGLGAGLLLSIVICGWFARFLVGAGLIVLGLLLCEEG